MNTDPLLNNDQVRGDLLQGGAILKTWGAKVTSTRESLGLSREDVARLADTTPATLSRVEGGKLAPRDYLRIAIATALASEVSDIFPYPHLVDTVVRYNANNDIAMAS